MRTSVAFLIVALAGCSSVPELPTEIRVPVPVPCIDRTPARPSLLADAELLALDDFGLVVALARDRRIRQAYQLELEAGVAGCR